MNYSKYTFLLLYDIPQIYIKCEYSKYTCCTCTVRENRVIFYCTYTVQQYIFFLELY